MPPNPTELLAEQVQLLQGIQAELKQLAAQEKHTADNVAQLHKTVALLNAQVELDAQSKAVVRDPTSNVRVIDVPMPLEAMVRLILKWAVATLLASVILAFAFFLLFLVLSLVFGRGFRLF
jgi:hypothetical protein